MDLPRIRPELDSRAPTGRRAPERVQPTTIADMVGYGPPMAFPQTKQAAAFALREKQ